MYWCVYTFTNTYELSSKSNGKYNHMQMDLEFNIGSIDGK